MEVIPMAYLSGLAQSLTPYQAGEQPKDKKYIKLNTNENPYPPSPKVEAAMREAAQTLQLYPDMDSTGFCKAVAKQNGVRPEQVFAGNGSDEVLAFAFAAFFAGKRLLAPDITYSFYPVYAKLFGAVYETVPLNDDFSMNVQGLLQDAPVAIANPNAPTGIMLPLKTLEKMAEHLKGQGQVFLIDEAYEAFAAENAVSLLERFDNVLIVRTLSKSHALAGLRVGYAMGHPALIDGLNRVKDCFNSYSLDRLAQAAATAAMEDAPYYGQINKLVAKTRDLTRDALIKAGIPVLNSSTNFLFVKADETNAARVFMKLKERGILVRHFDKPRIAPYLRISIGTPEQMEVVVRELVSIIRQD
jgi:histidinol-phosphate aminotransferase